jgi:hypothetical protein
LAENKPGHSDDDQSTSLVPQPRPNGSRGRESDAANSERRQAANHSQLNGGLERRDQRTHKYSRITRARINKLLEKQSEERKQITFYQNLYLWLSVILTILSIGFVALAGMLSVWDHRPLSLISLACSTASSIATFSVHSARKNLDSRLEQLNAREMKLLPINSAIEIAQDLPAAEEVEVLTELARTLNDMAAASSGRRSRRKLSMRSKGVHGRR